MQIVGQNPDSRPRHSSQSPIFLRRPQSKVRGEPILLSFKLGLYLIRTRSPKRNPNLLQRSEIVALFNTFNRLSESLQAIQRFRQMYHERLNSDNMVSINLSFSIFVYLTWLSYHLPTIIRRTCWKMLLAYLPHSLLESWLN